MADLTERQITLVISYDRDGAEGAFPRWPGADQEPPIESVEFLVQHLAGVLRSASLTDPALRRCEVDLLTIDHRTKPKQTAPTSHPDDF